MNDLIIVPLSFFGLVKISSASFANNMATWQTIFRSSKEAGETSIHEIVGS